MRKLSCLIFVQTRKQSSYVYNNCICIHIGGICPPSLRCPLSLPLLPQHGPAQALSLLKVVFPATDANLTHANKASLALGVTKHLLHSAVQQGVGTLANKLVSTGGQ